MKTPEELQRLADHFAVSNATMTEFLCWHEGEMHHYHTELQGKIIDLTLERDEFDEVNKKLAGENRSLIDEINSRAHNQVQQAQELEEAYRRLSVIEEQFDKLSKERKTIIESNAAQALQITLLESKHEELTEQVNQETGRANALEEWLTDYQDDLKNGNVYHKNTGVINAINELLNPPIDDIP